MKKQKFSTQPTGTAQWMSLRKQLPRSFKRFDGNERYLALALAGEAGELANLIKKRWRDGPSPRTLKKVADEICDVRVYLELIAVKFGLGGAILDAEVAAKITRVIRRERRKNRR